LVRLGVVGFDWVWFDLIGFDLAWVWFVSVFLYYFYFTNRLKGLDPSLSPTEQTKDNTKGRQFLFSSPGTALPPPQPCENELEIQFEFQFRLFL